MTTQGTVLDRLLEKLGRASYQMKSVRKSPHVHRCKGGRLVPVDLRPHESGVAFGFCDDCARVFVRVR